ncbi:MAG: beta-ketoacyl-ACP reductase [Granulosicoccaceae bacterium]
MSRVALVTGGTSGLGSAIATRLANNYRVIVNYLPSLEAQAKLWQAEHAKIGQQIDTIAADISDAASCEQMANELLIKYGSIDVLINNAGITRDATLRKMPAADWQAVINTNLSGLFYVTQPLLNTMIKNGFGRIVNISSVNAQRGQFGQTNYSAAKAGVHGFTKALAQEVATKGITVNTISPGFIDTDMVAAIPDEQREQIITDIPVGRVGNPNDIARAVEFLVADDADYITGSELSVNGGIFMH